MALLNGISPNGFFNFCAINDRTISTAGTGTSGTAAAGPAFEAGEAELVGIEGAVAVAGAGASSEGFSPPGPDDGSSSTGSTS